MRNRTARSRCGAVTRAFRELLAAGALLPALAVPAVCAQGVQIPDDVKANVRARVDNGWSVGIVVGVVDSAGARYFAYGNTARTGGQPVNERTVYEIGSITKVFTAATLADMVVRGEIGLDDPVQRFLPASVHVPSTCSARDSAGSSDAFRIISAGCAGKMIGLAMKATSENFLK